MSNDFSLLKFDKHSEIFNKFVAINSTWLYRSLFLNNVFELKNSAVNNEIDENCFSSCNDEFDMPHVDQNQLASTHNWAVLEIQVYLQNTAAAYKNWTFSQLAQPDQHQIELNAHLLLFQSGHPFFHITEPLLSSFTTIVGDMYDSEMFIPTVPKWQTRWQKIKFEDLPAHAHLLFKRYGPNAVWPPNVQQKITPAINGWFYSSIFRKRPFLKFSDQIIEELHHQSETSLGSRLAFAETQMKSDRLIFKKTATEEHDFNAEIPLLIAKINDPVHGDETNANISNFNEFDTTQFSNFANLSIHRRAFEPKYASTHILGFTQLMKRDGYVVFGSRQSVPFVSEASGFLFLQSPILDPSWATSIYFIANSIRRENAPHKFILDRYAISANYNLSEFSSFLNKPSYNANTVLSLYGDNNACGILNQLSSPMNTNEPFAYPSILSSMFGIHNGSPTYLSQELKRRTNDYRQHVNKLKFKNHLIPMWKTLRNEFARIWNLRFRFQHQLTTFLPRFYRRRGISVIKSQELLITSLLVRARFALNIETANDFVNAGWVFANGRQVISVYFRIFMHDVIQLSVSIKYFIYFRWLYILMLKSKARLLPRILLIASARRSLKKKPGTYPHWILNCRFIDEDIPSYLEVDFIALTAIVLFYPTFAHDYEQYNLVHLNVYSPKMLNWKFIT